jgi:hypothetical protein
MNPTPATPRSDEPEMAWPFIEKILLQHYQECDGGKDYPDAQMVNAKWYIPKSGCDSLGYVLGEMEQQFRDGIDNRLDWKTFTITRRERV